jgi:hypothetical protein
VGVHPLAIGQEQVLADLARRAKVVQTVGCSTFTRRAKPATRRVADGERMNTQEGVARSRQHRRDVEHQGDDAAAALDAKYVAGRQDRDRYERVIQMLA